MIIPHVTQCYRDSKDPPEEAIAMCTIRNFPYLIDHCIEWSRELFNKLFVERASNAVSFLENPDEFVMQLKIQGTGIKETLEDIVKVFELKKASDFTRCV
jgi:ubiquitin-activating enzyme E1